MKSLPLCCLLTLCLVGLGSVGATVIDDSPDNRPNVLLIICDDLNDSVDGLGGHPQSQTPNLDRLSESAVNFHNAQCSTPVCGPSRAALWTGIHPHKSGILGYRQNEYSWRESPVLKDAVTVFEHFSNAGYKVFASGKIFHNNQHMYTLFENLPNESAFKDLQVFGPNPFDGKKKVPNPAMKSPWGVTSFENIARLSEVPEVPPNPETGAPGFKGWYQYGKRFKFNSTTDRDLMVDEHNAKWAISRLQEKHEKPFFQVVGFVRPHTPWVAPDEFFDLFDRDSLKLPPYLENDVADCGPLWNAGGENLDSTRTRFQRIQAAYPDNEGWRMALHGYLACAAFVDHQVGKVLDALKASPYADNTIVIFTSDHGFHLGEKDHLQKLTVWEESTRVPLMVRLPGNTANDGAICETPVSLIDLYPTLIDLCGLPDQPNEDGPELDGHSILPLVRNPASGDWGGPSVALTSVTGISEVKDGDIPPIEEQNYSIRSRYFRYIRWADGFEEFYDHRRDPHEWHNIVSIPDAQSQLKEHRTQLDRLLAN